METLTGISIRALWMILCALWIAGAITTRRAKPGESGAARLQHGALIALGFLLLFWQSLWLGPLETRFVPDSTPWHVAGVLVTAAGIGFAIWARWRLGGNGSAAVILRQDHELVQSGPYRFVRHPIYSGLLAAALGTALAFGAVRGLVAVLLLTIAWRVKSHLEETLLKAQFGMDYILYERRVKALIPFLW